MIHLFAGAKLAQPVEEVTAAVDGGAQHLLVQFPVGYLLVVLDSLFPAVGHAGLLVPLGIDREIGVGVIGVAAQTAGFLQDHHLFPRHGSPDGGHQAAAGAAHHHVGLLDHQVVGRGVGIVLRVDDGGGMTHPGAQAALHALVRVDFIFAAHIINGLHGTFCGAVVAADTVFCDLIHPVPFLPLNDFEPLEPNLKRKLLKINIIITETLPD